MIEVLFIKGIPSDDYPNLPFVESGTSLNIDPSSFLKALKSTIFASSSDESKQLLTGLILLLNKII